MTDALTPDQLDEYVLAYLDGTLDPDAFEQLSTAMRSEPGALDRFIELACLDRWLLETLANDEQVDAMHRARHEHADPALSFQATLELLSRGSESAELVHLHHDLRPRHRLMPYLVGGAVAAVFVLAITLSFVFSGESTSPRETASWPDTLPTTHTPIATLTNTRHATWAGGPASARLTTGHALAAGQRLNLTTGFAEITTARGAIATLHAPCQVELLDKNTMRLVQGRLSGRVESTRAKGFTVVLPNHDRIVDLGTAFSVAVDDHGQAEVRVTEGLVMWTSADDPSNATDRKPLLIAAGESAALAEGRPVLSRVVRLLGVDFQHTGTHTNILPRPMVGTTQPGFEAFDQTRVANGNGATFATDAGDITVALAGLDQLHNGYFTRLPTPAEDPFPGFDLYNDFIFENTDGRFTLTLTGPGIVAGQAYDLTFYTYDPGYGTGRSRHGQTQGVAFTGIDGTTGQAGPITYVVGTHPEQADQYSTTAVFTADDRGRVTIQVTDAHEDDEHRIRLCAIEIARRLTLSNEQDN